MSDTINHVVLDSYHTKAIGSNKPGWDFTFILNRPGRISIDTGLWSMKRIDIDIDPDGRPGGRPITPAKHPFKYVLLDPDRKEFTKSIITLKELDKYRDLRGTITGMWTLRVLKPENFKPDLVDVQGDVKVTIIETIKSLSAAPVIHKMGVLRSARNETFDIDLYRIGKLKIILAKASYPFGLSSRITMTLKDPDGEEFATSNTGELICDLKLKDIAKSRNNKGHKKMWSLTINRPANVIPPSDGYILLGKVYDTLKIKAAVLKSRLDVLLGNPNDPNFTFAAKWDKERETNLINLTLHEERLAETLGLQEILRVQGENPEVMVDVDEPELEKEYTLDDFEVSDSMEIPILTTLIDAIPWWDEPGTIDWRVEMNIKTKSFQFGIKKSLERIGNIVNSDTPLVIIPRNIPMLWFKIKLEGAVKFIIEDKLLSFKIPELRIEIGLDNNKEGQIEPRIWIDPASILVNNFKITSYALKLRGALLLKLNNAAVKILVPVFDALMGGRFHFTSTKWVKNTLEFEYITNVEKERLPNPGYVARGKFGPQPYTPVSSGSDILNDKIEHIVVLMMENRSFDHVLGYRSLKQHQPEMTGEITERTKVDGLTKNIIAKMKIRPLSEADGRPVTKFPFDVGHGYKDVQQQLADKTMSGFIDNFLTKVDKDEAKAREKIKEKGYEPRDVLGYYTDAELPMYGFLADEFAICDRFFCSHPGPTLPNRMFSLLGDLYVTRYGEPQFENGVSTLSLSRQTSIFDVLTQEGISWRQYESPPSVSMLRYFARYAGNNTDIRDIRHLEEDVMKRGFPAVTFVDPAFHYEPANDDHPPLDLMGGQVFIKRVYEALRSNPKLWKKTLFIVTYDEHGGLFDHVVPDTAEALQDPERMKNERREISTASNRKKYLPNQTIDYGIRVPTFLISPYIEAGTVFHNTWDFTSILKTILNKFCPDSKPFLSDRVAHAEDLSVALTLDTAREITNQSPRLRSPVKHKSDSKMKFFKKSDLTKSDAEWHNFMEVLGRMIKG